MTLTALALAVPAWLSALVVAASLGAPQRPYELEIHRPTAASIDACSFLSIRRTQPHKDLVGETDLITTSGDIIRGEGAIQEGQGYFTQYLSYDVDLLWDTAISQCGAYLEWSFPVYVAPEIPVPRFHDDDDDDEEQITLTSDGIREILGTQVPVPPLEIASLGESGPSSNRIDFVFFGDGYTSEEKDKFLQDAERLASDISNNQTFATVKPLLNFWAAFTPSNESGIGVGGQVKDTPFGLYREGTELRAVYYAKPEVASAACLSLGDMCDYPILLANDPLYGGLGGRFTVTTSSIANGALVLRHELGHSVIREGEEYDGGFAYYGPNAANLTLPFKWQHWLTDESVSPRAERSVMPIQAYPWSMLNGSDPWVTIFDSSGLYSRFVVRFSLSGLPDEKDLTVKLDGKDLGWKPKEGLGLDRWHYDIHINHTLQAGPHSVSYKLENSSLVGLAQLCSMEVIEFGTVDEFNNTPGFIGAFPTYSDQNETTYRPTNEGCLMRIVTTPTFCSPCIEGLWHELLKRVDLIDNVSTSCISHAESAARRTIEVKLLDLAQFRKEKAITRSEAYLVSWQRNGVDVPEFANRTSVAVDGSAATYTMQVKFITDEVRVDPGGYLLSAVGIAVPQCDTGHR